MMFRLFSVAAILASTASAFAPPSLKNAAVKQSPLFKDRRGETGLNAESVLTQTELPEKIYIKQKKEFPKVLGGLQIGLRKLVVITGASSGLGLNCAASLAKSGRYFVVMACRDVEKAKQGKVATIAYCMLLTAFIGVSNPNQ